MERILITGGSGLLGSNIAKIATSHYEVYSIYNKNPVKIKDVQFLKSDLSNENQLKKIENINPDFIINCAALTDVDFCEKHPNETYRQNVKTSNNVAKISEKIDAKLIHISTDAVFNGSDGNYAEEDPPDPVNIYGKSKLKAEEVIGSINHDSCIVRTNIYGWNIRNKFSLAEWIINTLKKHESLNGFHDVFFSPIFVNDLTMILFDLKKIDYSGIIHIGSSDCISKLSFAFLVAEIFDLDKELITPISIEDLKLETKRPKKTCLDVNKARNILNKHIIPVKDGLFHMKEKLDYGYVKELKNG